MATNLQLKSMFYTDDEMAEIQAAIDAYERYIAEHGTQSANETESFLNELTGSKGNGKLVQHYYPQFFLEGLAYHSPTDWTVRINGQTFSPGDTLASSHLKLKAVDADKVVVEWHPVLMALVDNAWDRAASKDAEVDDGSGTVTFILHPNQTFSSYVMRTLEGKVLPVAITSADAAAAAGVSSSSSSILSTLKVEIVDEPSGASQPIAQPEKEAAPKQKNGGGIDGLFNAYDNIGKTP